MLDWENMKSFLELLIIPAVLVLLEMRKSLKEKQAETSGSVTIKETTDKTEITTLLLNQGQERYKDLITETSRLTLRYNKLVVYAQKVQLENVQLRNIAGMKQGEKIPGMDEILQAAIEDPNNPLSEADLHEDETG